MMKLMLSLLSLSLVISGALAAETPSPCAGQQEKAERAALKKITEEGPQYIEVDENVDIFVDIKSDVVEEPYLNPHALKTVVTYDVDGQRKLLANYLFECADPESEGVMTYQLRRSSYEVR
jgi:hypothetical protein